MRSAVLLGAVELLHRPEHRSAQVVLHIQGQPAAEVATQEGAPNRSRASPASAATSQPSWYGLPATASSTATRVSSGVAASMPTPTAEASRAVTASTGCRQHAPPSRRTQPGGLRASAEVLLGHDRRLSGRSDSRLRSGRASSAGSAARWAHVLGDAGSVDLHAVRRVRWAPNRGGPRRLLGRTGVGVGRLGRCATRSGGRARTAGARVRSAQSPVGRAGLAGDHLNPAGATEAAGPRGRPRGRFGSVADEVAVRGHPDLTGPASPTQPAGTDRTATLEVRLVFEEQLPPPAGDGLQVGARRGLRGATRSARPSPRPPPAVPGRPAASCGPPATSLSPAVHFGGSAARLTNWPCHRDALTVRHARVYRISSHGFHSAVS